MLPDMAAGTRPTSSGGVLRADETDSHERLLSHVSCTVAGAGCWLPVPTDWRMRPNLPANYVAMLCVGGGAEYRIGGETYALRPGELLLCPPRVSREGRHDSTNPLHLYSVHFQARLYGTLDMPAVYRLPIWQRPSAEQHARMVAAAQRIVTDLATAAAGHTLAAAGACAELLSLIWRAAVERRAASDANVAGGGGRAGAPDGADAAHTAGIARLAPVFRAIESQYAGPLTLEQLAAAVHLQPAYFSTLFRRIVGVSPMRYLARYRLDRARDLLLSSDLPLGEIARRTGFSEAPYLIRVFREAEGATPGEYRRTKASPMAP